MKTFDFVEATISHNLKDPHSKTLKPDRLFPPPATTTQPQREEGEVEGIFAWS